MTDNTLNELLNDVMNSVSDGFEQTVQNTYTDHDDKSGERWTGKVIDNNDPLKLGRVKVLVFGFYDDLSEEALPWAIPDIGYIGGTNGSFIIPEIGTILRGYFDEHDIQKPIFDSIAFTKKTAGNEYVNSNINKTEDYPHKMVLLETDSGDYLTLNKKTGETVFNHRTGLSITIGADGSLTINTGANGNDTGNVTINTDGNTTVNASGDVTVKAEKNVNIDSGPNGFVNLGRNPGKQFCNNLPNCLLTGIPHFINNTNVKC